MIFSENRSPLFGIMLLTDRRRNAGDDQTIVRLVATTLLLALGLLGAPLQELAEQRLPLSLGLLAHAAAREERLEIAPGVVLGNGGSAAAQLLELLFGDREAGPAGHRRRQVDVAPLGMA